MLALSDVVAMSGGVELLNLRENGLGEAHHLWGISSSVWDNCEVLYVCGSLAAAPLAIFLIAFEVLVREQLSAGGRIGRDQILLQRGDRLETLLPVKACVAQRLLRSDAVTLSEHFGPRSDFLRIHAVWGTV